MSFDISKPAWPPGDPRFENVKNIMLGADAGALLDLLEEYKRIAILELPEMIRAGNLEKAVQQVVGKIDFINELIAL